MHSDNLFVLIMLNLKGIGKKAVTLILDKEKLSVHHSTELIDVLREANKISNKFRIPTKEEILEAESNALRVIEASANKNITIVNRSQKEFPKRLLDLNDVPILFVKGDVRALSKQYAVAIVGTRQPTSFGLKASKRLAELFATNNFVIVSGLAKGCDTAAHKGCLESNGVSVAVLANSLDRIYPKENIKLSERILTNSGCLLSEYSVGVKVIPKYFIQRDRLQSGLSQAVIVIETEINGRTMYTVKFARKQKRKIVCLATHPEKLRSYKTFQGNLRLISDETTYQFKNDESIHLFMKQLKGQQRTKKNV